MNPMHGETANEVFQSFCQVQMFVRMYKTGCKWDVHPHIRVQIRVDPHKNKLTPW